MTDARSLVGPAVAKPDPASSRKAAFLPYLEEFRGVAIAFVVLIHANNAMLQRGIEHDPSEASAIWTAFHILSHNSTVYFALISGILYAYSLKRRPHGEFMQSRFMAVVLPYALFSTGLTLLLAWRDTLREGTRPDDTIPLLGRVAYNIVFGEAWNHLWYIPVITFLYVISPLLLRLVQEQSMRWLVIVLVVLPLVASRTATEVTPAMLVYFIGVYVTGLLIGLDPERTLERLRRAWPWLALAAVAASAAVAFLDFTGIEFVGPTSIRESAIYVLRISLGILMLIALREARRGLPTILSRTLKLLAAYSFGIYFIHAPLLRPIVQVLGRFVPEEDPGFVLVAGVLAAFVASLALSVLLVKLIKLVCGRNSKFLIGS